MLYRYYMGRDDSVGVCVVLTVMGGRKNIVVVIGLEVVVYCDS